MTTADMSELRKTIDRAISLIIAAGTQQPVDLAELGQAIKHVDPGFSPQKYGSEKLRVLLEMVPTLKIIKDDSIHPPRYFAERTPDDEGSSPSLLSSHVSNESFATICDKLTDFAYLPERMYAALARKALPERWSYQSNEKDDSYPLLRNYLKFTYVRLKREVKIAFSDNRRYAAFNTGLVDERYEPIYAFFSRNPNEGRQEWKLDDFCIEGENTGKMLVSNFTKAPESAYYFEDPRDAFYDIRRGEPKVDWEHVVVENPERIPQRLIERVLPSFKVKANVKTSIDFEEYRDSLRVAIKNDNMAYRMIMQVYKAALEVAIKKVSWNHRAAIPVYFPRLHRMSLLLPLAICSDDTVDVALVVERTDSGNYQGHTAYPLDWAYSSARLVCRPNSDWLSVDKISPSDDLLAASVDQSVMGLTSVDG